MSTLQHYQFHGELYSHQNRALEWMDSIDARSSHGMCGGILSLTQGLGKTLTAITYIVRKFSVEPGTSLVLVKKAVLPEWKRCIEQFYPRLLPDTLFFHPDYTPRSDLKKVTQRMLLNKTIVITTYETLRHKGYKDSIECCLEYGEGIHENAVMAIHCRSFRQTQAEGVKGYKCLYYTPWKCLIADESQVFANPTTATFRTVMGLYGKYKWCLTGTPIRNRNTDIFSQLRWCGMSSRIAKNKNMWRDFLKNEGYRTSGIDRYILSMDYNDAGVTIPKKIRHVIPITFDSEKERTMYESIRQKTIETLRSMSISRFVTFAHVLAMFTRLRQTCVAAHCITPQSKRDNGIDTASFTEDSELAAWCLDKDSTAGTESTKIRKVVEIVENVPPGEKVVVFSNFVAMMDIAEAAVIMNTGIETFMLEGSLSGMERDQNLMDFKRYDGTAVLFINYKVGAEGLNITEANHVICLEPWWNYSTHAQAESRCWRIGQQHDVHVYDILIRDSIESRILEICSNKRAMAEEFLGDSDSLVSDNTRLDCAMIARLIGEY